METLKLYQVDAFAGKLFRGNPAAVCVLRKPIPEQLMQSIGAENNLAETAFVLLRKDDFEIRWFTPAVEVELCGHASLAAAYVLFKCLGYTQPEIRFWSPQSGQLKVTQQDHLFYLDFPADNLVPVGDAELIRECIGVQPLEVYKGRTDHIAVVDSAATIKNLHPDLKKIAMLESRGLIVTAKGDDVDFVSRFFAPQSGIDEDPVTGSAHTSLIPLWSAKLGKKEMKARQLSKRGGELVCVDRGERSQIGGEAQLYMTGEIYIDA
jgi:PhzF family phenazine biosynthesis protein